MVLRRAGVVSQSIGESLASMRSARKGLNFDGSGHYSQELGGESGGPGAAEWVKNVADGTVRFGKGSFDELGGEGLFET